MPVPPQRCQGYGVMCGPDRDNSLGQEVESSSIAEFKRTFILKQLR